MRTFARWASRGLLLVMLLTVCVLGYAVGQQWFFRWRVSRLLADVKHLEVPQSNWPDFQRFRTRWGKWGVYSGSCDANHCAYRVIFGDSFPQRWYPWGGWPRHEKGRKFLDSLGVRPSWAFVGVEVLSDRVVSKAFGLSINQAFSSQYVEIAANSYEGSRLPKYRDFKLTHPNRYLQSGQRGYFIVSFTPGEASDEKDRLMHFRLSCITALRPCARSEDLLPEASAEYAKEPPDASRQVDTSCGQPLWVVARDATGVFVADVVSSKRVTMSSDKTPVDPYWIVQLHVTRALKGKFAPESAAPLGIPLAQGALGARLAGQFPFKKLVVIGLVQTPGHELDMLPLDVGYCGAVEATPANVAEAERGVNADYAPDQHWD